jgi:hypothetical protein
MSELTSGYRIDLPSCPCTSSLFMLVPAIDIKLNGCIPSSGEIRSAEVAFDNALHRGDTGM